MKHRLFNWKALELNWNLKYKQFQRFMVFKGKLQKHTHGYNLHSGNNPHNTLSEFV